MEVNAGGQWRQATCTLTANGLRDVLLGPARLVRTRSGEPAASANRSVLLFSDIATLDDQLVAFNLLARRSPNRGEHLDFELVFNAEAELPSILSATLRWGAQHRTSLLDSRGRAVFPDVPIADLLDAAREQALTDLQIIVSGSTPGRP